MKKRSNYSSILIILIFICLSVFVIQSCGYRMTEDDKYPDMEVYPQTSNPDYVIDSLFEINGKIRYTEKYMYASTIKKSDKDSDLSYLSVLDKELNILKEIFVDESSNQVKYNIDSDDNIYLVARDKELYRYTYPWKNAEKLPKIIDVTQTDSLKLVYADLIEKRLAANSLFYVGGFIDSIFNAQIQNLYKVNTCVLPIDPYKTDYYVVLNDYEGRQSYGIIHDYSEIWQKSYQNNKASCNPKIEDYSYSNKTNSPNLHLEQAALGNKSSGNHLVFWFTPHGYDYYKIEVNGDTIRFKIQNDNLSYPTFTQIGSVFTDKILLLENTEVLYQVRKK